LKNNSQKNDGTTKKTPNIMQNIQIYPNQIDAFTKIKASMEKTPYVLLVAQPQSGKTDTFLLCAFEFIRLNKVQRVVLFSGNSDLELKKQTLDGIADFGFKYTNYLVEKENIARNNAQLLFKQIKNTIQVIWSGQLLKAKTSVEKTLFIWEESHYAQSADMLPHQFMHENGVSASGILDKGEDYFLSVSATPFSEIADIVLQKQEKSMVYLSPGPLYKGVEYFMENELVLPHEGSPTELLEAIRATETRFPADKKIYGIIRCSNVAEMDYTKVARKCGWDIQHFNMAVKTVEYKDISLPEAPENNTIVFIKGALRMGKQVCKDHIGFVMETSVSSNTDTLLQGLWGRMFSFGDVSRIRVYIPTNLLYSGEVARYIQMIGEIENYNPDAADALAPKIPLKAMNMARPSDGQPKLTKHNTYTCSPVFLPSSLFSHFGLEMPLDACISSIFNDYGNELYSGLINKNNKVQTEEICEILKNLGTDFAEHKLSRVSNRKHLLKLVQSLQNGTEFHSNVQSQVQIWLVDELMPECPTLRKGDVFIEVKTANPGVVLMEYATSEMEVFCKK
jgi:hypothetical protein